MILSLKVLPSEDRVLRLSRSPLWRGIFILIALFLGAGVIILRGAPIPYLIIVGVSLLAGLYNERWTFEGGKLRIREGIGPLARTRNYGLDDFIQVSLRKSAALRLEKEEKNPYSRVPTLSGFFTKGRTILSLEFKDESRGRLLVDDGSLRDMFDLKELGNAIASFCGLPFVKPEESPAEEPNRP